MAAPVLKYSKLTGVLYKQFKKSKELVDRHWLDTYSNKYYETLERVLIPDCMNITADVPYYRDRQKQLLSYTHANLGDTWNFAVELVYRAVAEKEHQTEQNITKMYLLRGMKDMMFTMGTVLDDVSDHADARMGKKSWHKFCEGGPGAAIYDGAQIGWLSIFLLQKHFRNDPGYVRMMEIVSTGNMKMLMGQTMDMMGYHNPSPTMDDYNRRCYYKFGQYMSVGPVLALLHAGISSEEIINKTTEVFCTMGMLRQIWDDFVDYYCSPEQTGKPTTDIRYGRTTWVSAKAMDVFTRAQAKEFQECFGIDDPVKIERVRALYDEANLPELYVDFMKQNHKNLTQQISDIPHEKVREASHSYLEWLIGEDCYHVTADN